MLDAATVPVIPQRGDRHLSTDRRSDRPRVVVLARNYPGPGLPTRGLWVQRLVRAAAAVADLTVVAPIPYSFRSVPLHQCEDGIDVWRPRSLGGVVHRLHHLDARLDYPAIRSITDLLHAERPIDAIHAHFIYPEGVVAAKLGSRYGVPVVTTEHSFWRPWMDRHPSVWRQVQPILGDIRLITTVSEAVRAQVESMVGDSVESRVLHNVLDERTFVAPTADEAVDPNRLLFVGVIRHVKGLDILLRALAILRVRRPALSLVVIGRGFLRGYKEDERRVRRLADELRLADCVHWAGELPPSAVAALMRGSAVVVIPSRRESFCSVGVEALASGTPVVATRCGGPEEYVRDACGRLVPIEDPEALARAIEDVLSTRNHFDRAKLSAYAMARFGRDAAACAVNAVYANLLQ